jgi:methyl-accepting chemotaxis protein
VRADVVNPEALRLITRSAGAPRRFIARGMQSAFRHAAAQISRSSEEMSRAAARLEEEARSRSTLADQLESAVLTVSEQVATAATEMGASANGLARRWTAAPNPVRPD